MYKGSIVVGPQRHRYDADFPWYARFTHALFGWNWGRVRYGFDVCFRRLRYDPSNKLHFVVAYETRIYEDDDSYERYWAVLDTRKEDD